MIKQDTSMREFTSFAYCYQVNENSRRYSWIIEQSKNEQNAVKRELSSEDSELPFSFEPQQCRNFLTRVYETHNWHCRLEDDRCTSCGSTPLIDLMALSFSLTSWKAWYPFETIGRQVLARENDVLEPRPRWLRFGCHGTIMLHSSLRAISTEETTA